jgi:catalase
LAEAFGKDGLNPVVVGETLASGVKQTYSAADATGFDGVIVTSGAETLFQNGTSSSFFPADRPLQILIDAYRWGKPVGALDNASPTVFNIADIGATPGVFSGKSANLAGFVTAFEGGLRQFRFIDRFPVGS